MKKVFLPMLLISFSLFYGCNKGSTEIDEITLNEELSVTNGGETKEDISNYTEDPTIVLSNATAGGKMSISGSSRVTITREFTAPNKNITGAAIRFGNSGPLTVVQLNTKGQANGIISYDVDIPASVCDNMAQICHDIKCYEYAITDVGTISRANVTDMALKCGACSEPSCADIVNCGGCYECYVTGLTRNECTLTACVDKVTYSGQYCSAASNFPTGFTDEQQLEQFIQGISAAWTCTKK